MNDNLLQLLADKIDPRFIPQGLDTSSLTDSQFEYEGPSIRAFFSSNDEEINVTWLDRSFTAYIFGPNRENILHLAIDCNVEPPVYQLDEINIKLTQELLIEQLGRFNEYAKFAEIEQEA